MSLSSFSRNLFRAGVGAAIVLVPLVVYLRVEPLSPQLFEFWNGQRYNFDFFSFYKARLLVVLAALIVVGLIGLAVDAARGRRGQMRTRGRERTTHGREKHARIPAIALGVYTLMAVISTWTSPYRDVALAGFPDHYEGLFVLLAYLVIAFGAFAIAATDGGDDFLARSMAVSAVAVSVVGLLQYAGVDPFRTAWGLALIVPSQYAATASQLQYPADPRTLYATLFHYNYVGSYTALVLPFLLACLPGGAVSMATRRLAALGAGLLAVVWLVCGSRAGLVGGTIALLVLLVTLRKRLPMRPRALAVLALAAAAVVVSVVATIDTFAGGRLRARATLVTADVRALLWPGSRPAPPPLPIEILGIDTDGVRMRTPNGVMQLRHHRGNVTVSDGEGQPLSFVVDDEQAGRVRIEDPRFSHFVCTLGRINGQSAFVIRQDDYVLNFLLLDTGIRLALKTGRPLPFEPVAATGFEGRETLGSARAYIWSRSLPLLRRALVTGYGPDTVAMIFPQHDLTGKFRVYGSTDMLVDKVHNLFLQTALGTGVISALALLVLVGWYLASSVSLYILPEGGAPASGAWLIGVGCFAGVIGYLAAGLFNDSIVGVAPVFWAVLGSGIRHNSDHSWTLPSRRSPQVRQPRRDQ